MHKLGLFHCTVQFQTYKSLGLNFSKVLFYFVTSYQVYMI